MITTITTASSGNTHHSSTIHTSTSAIHNKS